MCSSYKETKPNQTLIRILYGERDWKVWEFVRSTSSDMKIPTLQDQTGCSIITAKWKPWSLILTSCFQIFIVCSPLHVRIKSYRRTVFRRRIYIQKVVHLELQWNSHVIWKQHYHCHMRGVVGVFRDQWNQYNYYRTDKLKVTIGKICSKTHRLARCVFGINYSY